MTARVVLARSALVGNPSDGYGGAVLSMPVPAYAATVTVSDTAPATEREPTIATNLLDATLRRFSADVAPAGGLSLRASTTIPLSVGLAGSSAIVIAALRALTDHVQATLSDREIAVLAHTIERVDLDIPGGWQDQIIQSNTSGLPLLMEFAEPIGLRVLSPAPIAVFVLWGSSGEQSSAIPHRDLRSRAHELTAVMSELADLARSAATALEAGDRVALAAAIDATFGLRESIMVLEPAHRHLVDVARSAGASCNYAGSGGAVAGLVPEDPQRLIQAVQTADLTMQTWQLEVVSEP